jgi:hypothetical protein
VSTAYYAVFHALARICADRLIGSSTTASEGAAWGQVYRALEHGFARNACEQAKALGFSDGIVNELRTAHRVVPCCCRRFDIYG